jgi:hypothetical protein
MQNRNKDKRINTLIVLALGCLLALAGVLLWMNRPGTLSASESAEPSATTEPAAAAEPAVAAEPAATVVPTATPPVTAIEEKWGIQVSGLSLTNAGSAVYLRYTVLAPEKTALLTGADAEVYLIDQASGTKLPMFTAPTESTAPTAVPPRTVRRMMRQAGIFPPPPSRLIAGQTYSLQIPNWGQVLKSGAKVTFVVGKSRVENLTVE